MKVYQTYILKDTIIWSTNNSYRVARPRQNSRGMHGPGPCNIYAK